MAVADVDTDPSSISFAHLLIEIDEENGQASKSI